MDKWRFNVPCLWQLRDWEDLGASFEKLVCFEALVKRVGRKLFCLPGSLDSIDLLKENIKRTVISSEIKVAAGHVPITSSGPSLLSDSLWSYKSFQIISKCPIESRWNITIFVWKTWHWRFGWAWRFRFSCDSSGSGRFRFRFRHRRGCSLFVWVTETIAD